MRKPIPHPITRIIHGSLKYTGAGQARNETGPWVRGSDYQRLRNAVEDVLTHECLCKACRKQLQEAI